MERISSQASRRGPDALFIGEVYLDSLLPTQSQTHGRCNLGHFAPAARTAWHRHINGQHLHVTAGLGITQSRGEPPALLRPGDTIWCPPGEWHWHGAVSDRHMSHLAFWDRLADNQNGPETEWAEHVDDAEYWSAVTKVGED